MARPDLGRCAAIASAPVFPHLATTTLAPNGMVCSIDPLASAAGVAMMRAGGSAADAAVAASAVLAVTSPHLCGTGGDLLALVHDETGPPKALNATGRAGRGADAGRLREEGHRHMPFRSDPRSVTVPGCVDGWLALHARFGRLPIAEVLAPAVAYAEGGFPASRLLAGALALIDGVPGRETVETDGACEPGSLVRRRAFGRTLRAVATGGRAAYYQGEFGAGLLAIGDGEFVADDLHEDLASWVDPIVVRVWGHDVWTMPPSSQGYLTLLALGIAEAVGLPHDPADARWCHVLAEAARAAGHDRLAVLHEHADPRELLNPMVIGERAGWLDADRRALLPAVASRDGDTIYLCATDRERMGVSLIQSNCADFGSHLIEPVTGVFLHNRGIGFSLDPGHPAEYGPGRRPPSTLSPALVTTPNGNLRACAGTMGGDVQPQVVVQIVARLLQLGQSPGAVLQAPRWVLRDRLDTGFSLWRGGEPSSIGIEAHAPAGWASGLRARGHHVELLDTQMPGTGHANLIENRGEVLAGAPEPRAGGAAVGY